MLTDTLNAILGLFKSQKPDPNDLEVSVTEPQGAVWWKRLFRQRAQGTRHFYIGDDSDWS